MTTPKAVASAKDRIKGAKRQRRSARINLRGDLRAEIEHLEAGLKDALDTERAPKRRLGQVPPSLALSKQIESLRDQMKAEWLDLELESQGWTAWAEWKASNPARDDNEYDKLVGVNFDVLVKEFMPKCVVEPVLDAEDWEGLFDKCAPGDIRDLGALAFSLHEQALDVPLVRLASATITRSTGDSEPQERGA